MTRVSLETESRRCSRSRRVSSQSFGRSVLRISWPSHQSGVHGQALLRAYEGEYLSLRKLQPTIVTDYSVACEAGWVMCKRNSVGKMKWAGKKRETEWGTNGLRLTHPISPNAGAGRLCWTVDVFSNVIDMNDLSSGKDLLQDTMGLGNSCLLPTPPGTCLTRTTELSLALQPEDLSLLPNLLTLIIINYNK